MKIFRKNHSRGQSMVLLALGFIGMLGFTGIAIDGGMLYSERRHAQNAADAASMAGALAILEGGSPVSAAAARAWANDYDNDGVSNWVTVNYPPVSGPYAGNMWHVQVIIRSRVDSVFAHFVFGGALESTVEAVGRAKAPTVEPFASGRAVVGLAESGCAVVWSHGSSTSTINGGGIHVNSNHPDCAFKASGSNVLDVQDANIDVVGGWEISGTASVSPPPTGGADVMEVEAPDPPTCSTNAVKTSVGGVGTITPGYINDFNFSGGTWTLASGVYCVDGGFAVAGGTAILGDGVMIYVMSGDVAWNGGASLNLHAQDDGEWAGLLLYQAVGNTEMATINGNGDSHFTGTMFFPDAEVQINGTGAADGFHSQVVGNQVDMSGTADLNIIYNEGENYTLREPAQVELAQ